MHQTRDRRTSYRIEKVNSDLDQLTLSVTIYPPAGEKENVSVGSFYRVDAVPEWVTIAMDMLDASATDGVGSIPFYGSKSGMVYWLHAEQVYGDRK
jgi:hypothetical protein